MVVPYTPVSLFCFSPHIIKQSTSNIQFQICDAFDFLLTHIYIAEENVDLVYL